MGMKYKDPTTGNFKEINVKVADTLPVGSEVDYNGTTIPTGWEEVDSPNDYSTEETKIGTWIDGKPLYRKIVDVKLANGFTEPVSYADNVAICYIVAGWIETGKVNMMIPTTDLHWYVRPYIAAGGLTVDQTNSDYVDKTARFIVEYTKTTD